MFQQGGESKYERMKVIRKEIIQFQFIAHTASHQAICEERDDAKIQERKIYRLITLENLQDGCFPNFENKPLILNYYGESNWDLLMIHIFLSN